MGCAGPAQNTLQQPLTPLLLPQQELDQKIQELKYQQQQLMNLEKEIEKKISRPPELYIQMQPLLPRAQNTTTTKNATVSQMSPAAAPVPTPVKPVTKSLVDHVSVVSQLYNANAVFAMPGQANITEEIRAQLIIDPVLTLAELEKKINPAQIQSATGIKISRIGIAQLEAPDFDIISATEAEQAIAETQSTEWIWILRPKKSGLHRVNIVLYAEVSVGSKTTKHKIQTFDQQIWVEITPAQTVITWWQEYWQWVIVTLILPLIKWFYDLQRVQIKKSRKKFV